MVTCTFCRDPVVIFHHAEVGNVEPKQLLLPSRILSRKLNKFARTARNSRLPFQYYYFRDKRVAVVAASIFKEYCTCSSPDLPHTLAEYCWGELGARFVNLREQPLSTVGEQHLFKITYPDVRAYRIAAYCCCRLIEGGSWARNARSTKYRAVAGTKKTYK